jgi:hypothetical protein
MVRAFSFVARMMASMSKPSSVPETPKMFVTARAANRRFGRSSALRAHT